MPKIPKIGTLVQVEWNDAHSYDKWLSPGQVEDDCRPMKCRTHGMLMAHESGYVSIAGTINLNPDGSLYHATQLMHIPHGMIRRIRKLKV